MEAHGSIERLRAALCRPVVAAAALLSVYVILSFGMSPRGYLGTDTGAKVATLEVMVRDGTARPFVGYWAEAWDPDGDLHPILDARPVDDDWVHVTTLPMLELARPLYRVGSYRLALLLPMLGAVGAAFAARSLARRAAGDDRAGWLAYWVVGVASPITVYALDLWEHAPGVACMVGAVAVLAGVVDGERALWRALAAGALFGVAATMRSEALVYSLVAVGLCCLVLVRNRRVQCALTTGALAVAGFAGPWIANRALEAALGGHSRTARATRAAAGGFDRLGDRAREAVITVFALRPGDLGEVVVLGGALASLLALAVIAARRIEQRHTVLLLALAGLLHLVALSGGLGFVPGMIAAAPLVVVGVTQPGSSLGARYAAMVALCALPLVWGFQLVGGASPQWAGRYALSSCVLLVALGAAALVNSTRALQIGFIGLSVLVTVSGVGWLAQRSHDIERLFEQLVDRPEDVVVVRNGFFIREGGPAYLERRWLTAVDQEDLRRAVEVVAASGHDTFAVFDEDGEAPAMIGRAVHESSDRVDAFNVRFYLHSYRIPER